LNSYVKTRIASNYTGIKPEKLKEGSKKSLNKTEIITRLTFISSGHASELHQLQGYVFFAIQITQMAKIKKIFDPYSTLYIMMGVVVHTTKHHLQS